MKEDENLSLKNKFLFGGWISIAAKACRHEKVVKGKNLPRQFENWIYREYKVKKQTVNNYRNLYKWMSVAPKLLKCRVNMTYFIKKYENLLGYFEENEEQLPWKPNIYCACEACISYFSEE